MYTFSGLCLLAFYKVQESLGHQWGEKIRSFFFLFMVKLNKLIFSPLLISFGTRQGCGSKQLNCCFCVGFCYLTQANFKLLLFSPQPSECQDFRFVSYCLAPPHLPPPVLGDKTQGPGMGSMSFCWATTQPGLHYWSEYRLALQQVVRRKKKLQLNNRC